jgi:hypothetical protein
VKWAILLVVVILTAPTILGRFERDARLKRRGPLYRSVQRYGCVPVLVVLMLGAAALLALVLVFRHA